ncbi:nuclear transport factor 2 family protein [Pseudochelatococcus sp. B33]
MKLGLPFMRSPLIALALIVNATAAQANTEDSQREEHNEAIVREAFEAWSSEGGNVFGILSPDVKWTILGSGPVAGTYKGVEEFLRRASLPLVQRLATPLRPTVHHIWAAGDMVIIRFDASSTTTSGRPYNNQFVWIFRLDNGKVVEAEAFLDLVAYQEVVDNNQPRAQ